MRYVCISFLFFFLTSQAAARGIRNSPQETDSLAYYYRHLEHPENSDDILRAYRFYSKEAQQSLKNGDTLEAIQNLRQVAIGQTKLGLYYESEATAVEALKLLDLSVENESTREARVGLYNQLGRIYKALFDNKTALTYYDKALGIAEDPNNINILRNNRALLLYELKEYPQAEEELEKIYENSLHQTDQKQVHRALDNLGFIQGKLGRKAALPNLMRALAARERDNDLPGMYSSYKNVALYYLDRQEPGQARIFAGKAYQTAQNINSISFIKDALSLLMGLSGDPLAARYRDINDSILRSEITQENKYTLIKYNYYEQEKLARQNELMLKESQLQNEIEQRKRLQYQGIAAFVVLLLIGSFFIYRYRYRKGKLKQVYQTETRISKKLHDELSNDVYNLMARMQQDRVNETMVDYLADIYQRTRDISKENSSIETGERYPEVLSDMLSGYIPDSMKLVLRGIDRLNWGKVTKEKKIVLYRVLQELMTNMRKHSRASLVAVNFETLPGILRVIYADNGVGMHNDAEAFKRGGLQNAENRISSIDGTFTFGTMETNGFQAEINIPT